MSRNNSMLRGDKFDFAKFRTDLEIVIPEGETLRTVSTDVLGRNDNYLTQAFWKCAMPGETVTMLCKKYGLRKEAYMQKPVPPKPVQMELDTAPRKGWESTLSVNIGAGIVSLAFFKDGQKVASGRAKIFDSTEHGVMQAISYAAHMCYKFSEQRELFIQNQGNTIGGCTCKTMKNTETR